MVPGEGWGGRGLEWARAFFTVLREAVVAVGQMITALPWGRHL